MSVLGISEGAHLVVLWTFLKLEWASMHLIVGFTWIIEHIIHLASLFFLSLNFDFVSDYQVSHSVLSIFALLTLLGFCLVFQCGLCFYLGLAWNF